MAEAANSSGSMSDIAYHGIIELIRQGQIAESDYISHRRLANRLSMSKLPVGTALKRLEQEGVVKSLARVGTRLNRIDAQGVWDLLQWRIALESQTARLANQWMTTPEREALIQKGREIDQAISAGDECVRQADVAFHLLVADASKVRQLRVDLERLNIYDLKLHLCEAVHAAAQNPPNPPPNHETLAKVIAHGSADEAEHSMRAHLQDNSTVYGFVQWYCRKRQLESNA